MEESEATTPARRFGPAGRYVIHRELGRGMMGVVYEAEDTVLGRTVALKTIELAFGVGEEAQQEFERRFVTEAKVAAKLSHPGIVVCHDVGKDAASGQLFIVFEYLKGLTLADRVRAAAIPWRSAAAIVVEVARAIDHAHANGVIHRDLKPANVMLLDGGPRGPERGDRTAIKIMDFGIARLESLALRLTRTGQALGSPLYMSPEQVLGHAASARSDIFSLGSVLCTLLLGRGWFEARSIPEILSRVVHDDAPVVSKLLPALPAELDAVVARALAKRPEDRYASAAEMADDLEDILAGRAPRHASAFPIPALEPGADETPPANPLASLLDEVPASAAMPDVPSVVMAELTFPVLTEASGSVSLEDLAELTLPSRAATEGAFSPQVPASQGPPPQTSEPPPAAVATGPGPERKAAPESTAAPRAAPRSRIGVLAAGGVAVLLVTGAYLLLGRAPERAGPPDERTIVVDHAPEAAPSAVATPEALGRSTAAPSASAPSPRAAAIVRPPTAATTTTIAPEPEAAVPAASVAAPGARAAGRVRLDVEHPFENGRLIVWIDGVLVYETKLRAPVSKTIVAIKLRQGHVEKLLDVEPGRHEVRVEVSWAGEHRAGTRLIDVAAGSAGRLEVRVAKITKRLTLEWSRSDAP